MKIAQNRIQKHIESLKNEDKDVRTNAAIALGKIGSNARIAVPNLIELLKDKNPLTRLVSAWALGEIGDKAAVPALRKALKSLETFPRAAEALGKIGDPSPVPELIEGLKSDFEEVRGTAALALVKIGKPAVTPIIKAFGEGISLGGVEIITVLGEISDPLASPFLTILLGNKSELVRGEAAAALLTIINNNKNAIPNFTEAILKDFNFVKALKDKNPQVRLVTALVIGEIGYQAAIPALKKALKDKHEAVHNAVATALKKLLSGSG
jgi:HEAT repeat protein